VKAARAMPVTGKSVDASPAERAVDYSPKEGVN
jgi:hypothetical protein